MQYLEDVEQMHHEHPRTCQILDRAVRESLRPGDQARCTFVWVELDWVGATERSRQSERLWVEVKRVLPGPRYLGLVANQPLCQYLPKFGDEVDFGPEHVLNIQSRSD